MTIWDRNRLLSRIVHELSQNLHGDSGNFFLMFLEIGIDVRFGSDRSLLHSLAFPALQHD